MKLRLIGLALVAAFAFTAVATAGAHEFKASKTGTLTGAGVGNQTFHVNAGNVVCEKLALSGSVTALASKTQKVTGTYSTCEAFGSKVTITAAEYVFNAEGSVEVANTVTITNATGKCSVKVTPAGNSALKTVKYSNSSGKITTSTAVQKINYEPNGSTNTCGTTKLAQTNGTYTGEATTELTGGTIEWV
jgi:uncharacterized iron-regulated membrane protein